MYKNQPTNKSDYTLSRSLGNGITTTRMESWRTNFSDLVKEFSQPRMILSKLDAPYFLRADATERKDKQTADTACALILDGDKQISASGELIEGAPPLNDVANVLELNNIPFVAHTTFSHTSEQPRYRFIIPCYYEREHLEPLLNSVFDTLHTAGVMLADVKENNVWAQAWFMPSVGNEQSLTLFQSRYFSGMEAANV